MGILVSLEGNELAADPPQPQNRAVLSLFSYFVARISAIRADSILRQKDSPASLDSQAVDLSHRCLSPFGPSSSARLLGSLSDAAAGERKGAEEAADAVHSAESQLTDLGVRGAEIGFVHCVL